MSKTSGALLMKFVLTLGAAWVSFSLFANATFTSVLIIAIAGTLLNYLIGDLFVLPNFGNIMASIGDGGLAALTAYVISRFTYGFAATATSFVVFAVLISIAEYFFHIYLLKSDDVAPNIKTQMNNRKPDFNLEVGDESDFYNNEYPLNVDEQNFDEEK